MPAIPVGLPSTLLQRRPRRCRRRTPDGFCGQRRNRRGPRRLFSPDFSIGAAAGYQSVAAAGLLTAPNRFWALGPGVVFNLFDAGLRDAKVAQARAALDQAAATYRATALTAFQQVEDDLSRLEVSARGRN